MSRKQIEKTVCQAGEHAAWLVKKHLADKSMMTCEFHRLIAKLTGINWSRPTVTAFRKRNGYVPCPHGTGIVERAIYASGIDRESILEMARSEQCKDRHIVERIAKSGGIKVSKGTVREWRRKHKIKKLPGGNPRRK